MSAWRIAAIRAFFDLRNMLIDDWSRETICRILHAATVSKILRPIPPFVLQNL
jgi:hypothetical protein